jgi:hypothetical protein
MSDPITSDNTHLSRPTMAQLDVSVSPINCTHSLPDAVTSYVWRCYRCRTHATYCSFGFFKTKTLSPAPFT